MLTWLHLKDSITNKLLQIIEWLNENEEEISFEDSYLISRSIMKTLGNNLLVTWMVFIFIKSIFLFYFIKRVYQIP